MDSAIVIGGGVVGLAIARELAGRGCRVLVLEARRAGAGASPAAVGVLQAPLGRSPLAELSRRGYELHAPFARELREETGIDTGYRECGSIHLQGAPPADLARELERREAGGVLAAWRSGERLGELIPGYGGSYAGGLETEREAIVHPARLIDALVDSCCRRGVETIEGAGELELTRESPHRVAVAPPAPATLAGAPIVLAAGAWSSRAARRLPSPEIAVEPVRGQALEVRFPAPRRIVHFALSPGGPSYYLVPRADDRIWVGSTVEHAGFDERTSREGRAELLTAARYVLPGLAAAAVVRQWAGLRPKALRRGGPFLGRWPGIENLWVATGSYRSGILHAPAVAEAMAALILDGAEIDADFHPGVGLPPDR